MSSPVTGDDEFHDAPQSRVQSSAPGSPSLSDISRDDIAAGNYSRYVSRYDRKFRDAKYMINSLDVEHREDLSNHLYAIWLLAQKDNLDEKRRKFCKPSQDDPQQRTVAGGGHGDASNIESPAVDTSNIDDVDMSDVDKAQKDSNYTIRRLWRAWPLPPDQLPPIPTHGSSTKTALEEALQATILRQAAQTLSAQGKQATSDDEFAEELCNPIIKETMKKFDNLLIGLYRSREGFSKAHDDKNELFERTFRRPSWRTRGRTKNRRKVSTKQMRADDDDDDEEEEDADQEEEGEPASEDKDLLANELGEPASDGTASRSVSPQPERATVQQDRSEQNKIGLVAHSNIIAQAAIQGWSSKVLHTAGPRLNSLFPNTPLLTFVQSLENSTLKPTLPRRWGGNLPPAPILKPVTSNQLTAGANLNDATVAGVVVHYSMVEAWKKQDAIERWRKEGGGVTADGYLESVPKRQKRGGNEYKKEARRREEREKVYKEMGEGVGFSAA